MLERERTGPLLEAVLPFISRATASDPQPVDCVEELLERGDDEHHVLRRGGVLVLVHDDLSEAQ